MSKLTLALTIGDPLGIGPEITAKFLAWHYPSVSDVAIQVYGAIPVLTQAARQMGVDLPETDTIRYIDTTAESPGQTTYRAIERAVTDIVAGKAHGLVTGPIAKNHLHEAGILANGHTELLELLARQHFPHKKPSADMLFVYRRFRMLLLTRHIPLSRVPTELHAQNNRQTLRTLCRFLTETCGIHKPRIAVLGVNPHAGEIGGTEEAEILTPLINTLNAEEEAVVEGPFAADAMFRDFDIQHVPYDAYVAAYHDQGLLPFKLIAGHRAVNVTIGLPFIRTSVGHGTAFDIAGQGIATEAGLAEAVRVAIQLVSQQQRKQITSRLKEV